MVCGARMNGNFKLQHTTHKDKRGRGKTSGRQVEVQTSFVVRFIPIDQW